MSWLGFSSTPKYLSQERVVEGQRRIQQEIEAEQAKVNAQAARSATFRPTTQAQQGARYENKGPAAFVYGKGGGTRNRRQKRKRNNRRKTQRKKR